MTTVSRLFLVLALATASAGCGSKTAGDPLAPTGSCAVAAPATLAPYPVELQFRDNSTAPLYIFKSGCTGVTFGVTSCASGFTAHLADMLFCACSCDVPRCGNNCPPCLPDEAQQIVGGDSVRVAWSGVSSTAEMKEGVTCATSRTLPAGRYRVSITVFDSAEAALAHTGGRVMTQDFELPSPADLVDVPLAP